MATNLTLERTNLQKKTELGKLEIKKQRVDFVLEKLNQIKLKVDDEFKNEYDSVVKQIYESSSKGKNFYHYPILAFSSEKEIWKNNCKRDDGDYWIEGNYDLIKLTLSNIYKIEMPYFHYLNKDRERMWPMDKDCINALTAGFMARRIAIKCIKSGLDVYCGQMDTVTTFSFQVEQHYKSSHHKLHCLYISWK